MTEAVTEVGAGTEKSKEPGTRVVVVGPGGPGNPSNKGTFKPKAGGGAGVNPVCGQLSRGKPVRRPEGLSGLWRQFTQEHAGVKARKEIHFF